MEPKVGDIFEFEYQYFKDEEPVTTPLIVTRVDGTHVYYKFSDSPEKDDLYRRSYPMTRKVWDENANERVYVGHTDDPAALVFFT